MTDFDKIKSRAKAVVTIWAWYVTLGIAGGYAINRILTVLF